MNIDNNITKTKNNNIEIAIKNIQDARGRTCAPGTCPTHEARTWSSFDTGTGHLHVPASKRTHACAR